MCISIFYTKTYMHTLSHRNTISTAHTCTPHPSNKLKSNLTPPHGTCLTPNPRLVCACLSPTSLVYKDQVLSPRMRSSRCACGTALLGKISETITTMFAQSYLVHEQGCKDFNRASGFRTRFRYRRTYFFVFVGRKS